MSRVASIHSCWVFAAWYSRALSIAIPAAPASASTSTSSASVKVAPSAFSVRYRLPNT